MKVSTFNHSPSQKDIEATRAHARWLDRISAAVIVVFFVSILLAMFCLIFDASTMVTLIVSVLTGVNMFAAVLLRLRFYGISDRLRIYDATGILLS